MQVGGQAGPVTLVAAAVAAGRVCAVDAVSEALSRIERDDPPLGAVVATRADEALAEAAELDRRVARGEPVGRLAGVPVLVKDLEDVRGMPTRKGSLLLADAAPAANDGLVPERLRVQGAIVLGKTALPEFAIEGYTASLLTGVTRNPWAPEHSPGGSSGGSAAAVSAGLVPVATATDGGGSIRIPAAFCGLVGIKPTRGLVGRQPVPDWIDLSTDGPLATTVGDLRLLLDIVAGDAVGDPEAAPGSGLRGAGRHPELPALLLVAERTSDLGALPPSVAAAFASAAAAFADLTQAATRTIEPGTLFTGGDPDLDWFTLAAAEHVSSLGRGWVLDGLPRMHPSSQEFFVSGLDVAIDDYLAARRRRFDYVRVIDELLGSDRLLLTPTVAVAAVLADGRLTADDAVGSLPPAVYSTALQNVTGHPALTLPAGLCEGVPFGLQVTGPRFSDGWLLDLAARWEAAYPWPRNAPGYLAFPHESVAR
jgi:Asp-tRNA(Asn)/Glu-tRNA(Gln) amidotransferase A subunit family amidase